ncbi:MULTISPECIES: prolyl oligopeptidase family serine peptidase [Bacillus]|uniref:Peptidase n=2 Tax=Bacillus TaxID=1386 RepID=A0A0M5JAJ2_9BACI|nr:MULTISPECIES: prolyl oligopeptidase family serine peptidase [Bacillus]ALC83019.1 peptidase [Bacillus gobiensis]MBP1082044.1 putative peptidase [Bacillus capparidis]MED1096673.1 prolyl oligopeptidase family serine peptidase [Bacillus capparidis]
MQEIIKRSVRTFILFIFAGAITFSFSVDAFAKQVPAEPTSYRTVTEIHDWGAAITKVIVDLGKPVNRNSVTKDTFKVHVARSDDRLATPLLEEGYRTVTKAYVADKKGNPVGRGKYVVLEMEIGPTVSLGSALNYDGEFNEWVNSDYTITQAEDIISRSGTISGLVADTYAGGTKEIVDDFSSGKATYDNVTLTYADYAPSKDKGKNPLIIWLHGGGEGGTDTTIPLSANKAVNFATEEIQSYFESAYVLVPQTPTRWMDGFTGKADGTSIYQEALISLIKDYVAKNRDIDPNRIYIGGASNGGYMTMLMIRDYPGYFAAAFPVCEGLNDRLITNEDIQTIKDTPIWFVTAKNDTTLDPTINTLPTYDRLIEAGANNVQLSLFDDVHDTTGLYKNEDGTPYQYDGHSSWVYVFNNESTATINGKTITIMEWMAAQSLKGSYHMPIKLIF